jgi:hypothetical protein
MVVEEQQTSTDKSQEGKGPCSPEPVELAACSKVLNNSDQHQQEGVDFVQACFRVVIYEKPPAEVAAWPDFSVTPGSQKQAGRHK